MRVNTPKPLVFLFFLIVSTASAQQWGNYTLYGTMAGTTTYLIDTNSFNIHTWTHTTSTKTCYSSYLQPGGELLRTVSKTGNSFTGGPICGQVQKVDWNGNLIWNYQYSTTQYCTHHDVYQMPNGNVLLIAYERKTAAEATAAGSTSAIEMWPDKIVEVEPVGLTGGNIVWEWHAWDHLVQNVDPLKANYQTSIVNHPELFNINYKTAKDWMHLNGVSFNPMLNQITFSSHNLNEIYVIDHSTTTAEAAGHTGGNSGKGGDILYRWGNPAAYSAAGAAILNVTHDAHWIPEGTPNAGYLVAYNNKGISATASCVDIIDAPENGYNYTITPGSAFTPASYTLRQASGGYNSNMGGSQQLPNGNMIVTVATAGVIKEFDPNGALLWSKTATGSVPKAFRYDSCYVYNAAPAIPAVTLANDTLFADLATTYQWYFNGYQIAGATDPFYIPTQNGNYIVRITDANGCVYRYSEEFEYSSVTGLNASKEKDKFIVYPNPSTGLINIKGLENYVEMMELTVTDHTGKELMKTSSVRNIDMSGFANGIYFLSVKEGQQVLMNKKVVILK
jgi:Arylsulfotransferase (ASST)/Secretion system C-terminal sorting domain